MSVVLTRLDCMQHVFGVLASAGGPKFLFFYKKSSLLTSCHLVSLRCCSDSYIEALFMEKGAQFPPK